MSRSARFRRAIGVLAAGLTLSVALSGIASASYPACFGAASRDTAHPCSNPALSHMVQPTPSEALITPNLPCAPMTAPIEVCSFGVPAASAVGTVALIGDSHAAHWRAALGVVAQAFHWQVLSSTHFSCPFTAGITVLPEPKNGECTSWNEGVRQWMLQHPEISTVFTSDHPGRVIRAPGQSVMAAEVAGITSAWRALPETVKRIIVIRDIPYARVSTLPCVEQAIREQENAGLACALRRGDAMRRDPMAIAAERLHSPRVQVVDLNHLFCDKHWCFPVVGGALVYHDASHITSTFATTVGPVLLRRLGGLMIPGT